MNRKRQIQPDKIGIFERTQDRQTQAKAILHYEVNCLRVADSRLYDRNRFSPKRML